MTAIDLAAIAAIFEMLWWFTIGIFFIVFVVRMILNFLKR